MILVIYYLSELFEPLRDYIHAAPAHAKYHVLKGDELFVSDELKISWGEPHLDAFRLNAGVYLVLNSLTGIGGILGHALT